ncbi:phosphatidylserine/phosphatidylglycerophosphate/cardiolipin synthase family protein [Nonomuraea wenchangensis]
MPSFFSPLTTPDAWTYETVGHVIVPAGLRYGGYRLRGLRATPPAGGTAGIRAPALGTLRKAIGGGTAVVELQPDPFPARRLMAALPWGLPTFYLVLPDDGSLVAFSDGDLAAGGEPLCSGTAVTILMAVQDRLVLDPPTWAAQILGAITAVRGDAADWKPFHDAIAPLGRHTSAPVLLLDHTGEPRMSGEVDIVLGSAAYRAELEPGDDGDLQKAVSRKHRTDHKAMPIADLFSAGGAVTIRPVPAGAAEIQLARLEDQAAAAGEQAVSPAARHLIYTDLGQWFARQTAVSEDPADFPLHRYTRGNRVRYFVNGPEYFHDLLLALHDAAQSGAGRFDLAGWSVDHQVKLIVPGPDDPDDLPVTLQDACAALGLKHGEVRILASRLYQLNPGSSVSFHLGVLLTLVTSAVVTLRGVPAIRTDGSGVLVWFLLLIGAQLYLDRLFSARGEPLEQNKPAVDELSQLQGVSCVYSPYPATIDDNTVRSPDTLILRTLYDATTRFGVHHQKLALVRNATRTIGYCGGIDIWPDRLDDARHLAALPFHDVHARVEGPAVRDLALTFHQRWKRDGDANAAHDLSNAVWESLGTDIVQVARTYFRPAAPARRFAFAPQGDMTIHDTILNALRSARESVYVHDQYFTPPQDYRDALIAAAGRVKSLVVVMPGLPDQPFGEIIRTGLIKDVYDAAEDGVVHIGYPRLRWRLPGNDRRASSGKCRLAEGVAAADTVVAVGPPARVPPPPFWLAVEGELMYVHDEIGSDPEIRRLVVVRGEGTRLVRGGPAAEGARARSHPAGVTASVVHLPEVYVHAKLMIVDDVFLSLGSANLNRRGMSHDSEANIFTVPQALKADPANPVAALRRRLWAEMADLPEGLAAPLLRDPADAARLFRRSPLLGNRLVTTDTRPTHLMYGASTGDGAISDILQGIGLGLVTADHPLLFDSVIDPGTSS